MFYIYIKFLKLQMGETSFKFRCVKSYENSTKPKRENTHCTSLAKNLFISTCPTNSFLYELSLRKEPIPEGGGRGRGRLRSRSRVIAPDIRKETQRNKRRRGGWKREHRKARAPPIYLHRGGSEDGRRRGEREGGREDAI